MISDIIRKSHVNIGLSSSCINTANLCNNLTEKQNKICENLRKRLEAIEKRKPHLYFFDKEWKKLWFEFCSAIERSGYYNKIAGRVLKESGEYLERVKI